MLSMQLATVAHRPEYVPDGTSGKQTDILPDCIDTHYGRGIFRNIWTLVADSGTVDLRYCPCAHQLRRASLCSQEDD